MQVDLPSQSRVPWAVAVAVWLLVCLAGWGVMSHWRQRERDIAVAQAHSLVHALASSLRMTSARMAHSESALGELLAEIASTEAIDGVALIDLSGEMIAGTGIPSDLLPSADTPGIGQNYSGGDLIVWDTVDVGQCGGRRGWRWSSPTAEDMAAHHAPVNARLVVRIPLAWLDARQRRDTLAAAGFAAAGLALALGVVALRMMARRSAAYSARLHIAEEEKRAFEQLSLVAAGLAHEIRNPLGVIRSSAQRLLAGAQEQQEATPACRLIIEEIDRVASRLDELLSFARPRNPDLKNLSIAELIDDLRALLSDDLHEAGLELLGPRRDLPVRADPEQLRQLLFNLLHNAIRFAPGSGQICVDVEPVPGGGCKLVVRDHGPGVPEEVCGRIFAPYFTTAREGTGLGLAIVQRICRAHEWTIACRSPAGGGAAFEIDGIACAGQS